MLLSDIVTPSPNYLTTTPLMVDDQQAKPRRGPKPIKTRELKSMLRRQIVEGLYPPGGRLPTREQLQQQCKVSAITVQRALDELVRERFIVAKTKLGTFVVDEPPHLTDYAIVFNQSADSPQWSQFDRALANEASTIAA